MFFSAATDPGARDTPNEDWVAISPTAVVVLDGVSVPKDFEGGCIHGTPWYVAQLGTRPLTAATNLRNSLSSSLQTAIKEVASLHFTICDLSQINAPSAAVAAIRINEETVEYLVLADVSIQLQSSQGFTVVFDDRVSRTVDDLAILENAGAEIMKRRERYRNKAGGYWVAAADPSVVEHAMVGQQPIDSMECIVVLYTDESFTIEIDLKALGQELSSGADLLSTSSLPRRISDQGSLPLLFAIRSAALHRVSAVS